MGKAKRAVGESRNDPVPLHIRNAPTKLMKNIGYGAGYRYDHNEEERFSGQSFLPDGVSETVFYEPGAYGFEKEIQKRLDYWAQLKQARSRDTNFDK
jgi:putative ATPase